MSRTVDVWDHLRRDHWTRLMAVLVTECGDLDLAEEALADALEAAVRQWPTGGVPGSPVGWLLTVARRRVVDRRRHLAMAAGKLPLLADRAPRSQDVAEVAVERAARRQVPDERLRLVLVCCHPGLPPEARTALALRLVLGLPTEEVARLLLVPRATMAARITRAKARVRHLGVPSTQPSAAELAQALPSVVQTVELLFTSGYAPGAGQEPLRLDLAGEGVRLARLLAELLPDEALTRALAALVLLQHARRDARVADGELVLLSEQDRGRWHHEEVAEGLQHLDRALAAGPPSDPYAHSLCLQAAIAAVHDTAATAQATDWSTITRLYRTLEVVTGSPVVRLNRAVAEAEVLGPEAGLAVLRGIEQALPRHHRPWAVRAELYFRLERWQEACHAYDRALDLCTNEAERRHLFGQRRRAAARGAG